MPTYSYTCPVCGPFELVRPMAASASNARCVDCGAIGRRVYGAPAFRASAGAHAALEASERSADAPEVVAFVPPAGQRRRGSVSRYTTDPRHGRLPRP